MPASEITEQIQRKLSARPDLDELIQQNILKGIGRRRGGGVVRVVG